MIKRFGRWHGGHFLCDGTRHFRREREYGTCQYNGPCNGACRHGSVVKIDDLGHEEQAAIGIWCVVPTKAILIVQSGNPQDGTRELLVYDDRCRVTRRRFLESVQLAEGTYSREYSVHTVLGVIRQKVPYGQVVVVRNFGGHAVLEVLPDVEFEEDDDVANDDEYCELVARELGDTEFVRESVRAIVEHGRRPNFSFDEL